MSEALTLGIKYKGVPKNSVTKMNNFKMQYFNNLMQKISDENVKNFQSRPDQCYCVFVSDSKVLPLWHCSLTFEYCSFLLCSLYSKRADDVPFPLARRVTPKWEQGDAVLQCTTFTTISMLPDYQY